jgi:transposase
MPALEPRKSYRSFRWLYSMKRKGLSNTKIAEICGVARCTIDKWVKRLDIPKYLAMDRDSDRYREWREKVLSRDGFRCKKCGSRRDLQAHHIETWENAPKKRFLVGNGITLCLECHSKIHPWMRKIYEARKL